MDFKLYSNALEQFEPLGNTRIRTGGQPLADLARDPPDTRDLERSRLYASTMAEAFLPEPPPSVKSDRYVALIMEVDSVLEGERNVVARMASIASMLAAKFDAFSWAGFYVVDPSNPKELVVGPYQGGLGCLRIAFGRGVCGAVARSRQTLIVPDVDAFPGHIACDSRTRSEIVTPVFDRVGRLFAVLDVDSLILDAFDGTDGRGLEAIASRVFPA